ncbi:MAG TPA: hypothetical protein PKD53_02115 [Chloroflexaceae bacterium]|nr:hypothetical protein [Chloroflexaceae bacterium]
MPVKRHRPLRASIIAADLAAAAALKELIDFAPRNPAYSLENVLAAVEVVRQKREHEATIERSHSAATYATEIAELHLHDLMLGVKLEAAAQYGRDSDQIEALGLKKQSTYKSTARRSPATAKDAPKA